MTQKEITTIADLDAIDAASFDTPQIIFKHSIQCNISADAYQELKNSDFDIHYLDLINYRAVSNEIADKYNVIHKSPQVLIIKEGICVYNESHWRIKNELIQEYI